MKPMRHVAFTDNTDPDIMHVVPETAVRFELTRRHGKKQLVAIFDGQHVHLPPGTAAKFSCLEAMTAQGGYNYSDPTDNVTHLPGLPKGPAQ